MSTLTGTEEGGVKNTPKKARFIFSSHSQVDACVRSKKGLDTCSTFPSRVKRAMSNCKFGSSLRLEGKRSTPRDQCHAAQRKRKRWENNPLKWFSAVQGYCAWCEKEQALAPNPPRARGRGQRVILGVCLGSLDTKAERI